METDLLETKPAASGGIQAGEPKSFDAATRNVDFIAHEISLYGQASEGLWEMVLDEEATHAAELLAAQEMAYATVPRSFYIENGDLVDKHNQHLKDVINGGVESIRRSIGQGVPGSAWELRRRLAESRNVDKIIKMDPGQVCVEISASPFDKPETERKAQHYTDLTMIRASFKGYEGVIRQYNYVLPVSSPEFLQAVQTKLGREADDHILSSEELLENPIIQEVDEEHELAARGLDNLIGAALLEVSVGESATRMIRRAILNRREAWQFINSENNNDLRHELKSLMGEAALLPPSERGATMDAIRSGFWKELKDRFSERKIYDQGGGIIMAAAERAVADGDVFIACGSTVRATAIPGNNNLNAAQARTEIVRDLLEKVVGNGSCGACGAKGRLYGCGLCGSCNRKWCDIYQRTGRQTEISELSYQNYSRPGESILDLKVETFKQYWERIGEEIRQKRQIKKLRETSKNT